MHLGPTCLRPCDGGEDGGDDASVAERCNPSGIS
jgi:hypothetical protein